MRKLFFFVLLTTVLLNASAQDPNFSQFFVSPLTLNPALTGKFDGLYRVAANYRNQWPTINNAYTTYTASFDAAILRNRLPEIDQFGIGIMGFADKSGNGVLQHNYLSLSAAYHKGLDENGYNQLGVGFQGTFVSKSLDISKTYFEDQLRSDGFTGITSESFSSQQISVNYFDVNAGIFYNGTTDGNNNFYAGVSMYHINRHEESFMKGYYLLEPRITVQAGGKIPLANGDAIHLSGMHSSQAGASNTTFGGAYMLNLSQDIESETNLYLGAWYRWNDAMIPYVGLEFGDFRFGASYDVNTSSLKPASNMRGGMEISLIYIKHPTDPNAKKLNCPKF
jgi:type IX secretion system PorP/SprF family membrane protein